MSADNQKRSGDRRYVGGIWAKQAKSGEHFLTLGVEDKDLSDPYFNGSLLWKDKTGKTYLVKGFVAFKNKRHVKGSNIPQFQVCLDLDNPHHAILLDAAVQEFNSENSHSEDVFAEDGLFDPPPVTQKQLLNKEVVAEESAAKKLAAAQALLREKTKAQQPQTQKPTQPVEVSPGVDAAAKARRAELLKRYQ